MKKIVFLIAIIAILSSCTDAGRAKLGGYGQDFKIEMLSSATGEVIRTYHSSGKVNSEGQSDGYFFKDKQTNRLTEIAGGIIIITPEVHENPIEGITPIK